MGRAVAIVAACVNGHLYLTLFVVLKRKAAKEEEEEEVQLRVPQYRVLLLLFWISVAYLVCCFLKRNSSNRCSSCR